MSTTITTAARRITRAANSVGGNQRPCLLCFDTEGRGGEWYSQNSWPTAPIVFHVGSWRVTERQVQARLDESSLYGVGQ